MPSCEDCDAMRKEIGHLRSLLHNVEEERDEAERMLRGCEVRHSHLTDKLKAIKRGLAKRLTRKAFYELRAEIGL